MLIILLVVLAGMEAYFGHAYTVALLQVARDEAIIALDRITANRYFLLLRNALLLSIAAPLIFGPLALILVRVWGISAGRICIVLGFLLAGILLLAIRNVVDILARAIIVIFPSRNLETMRQGIVGYLSLTAAWQVFVGYLLFTFGIYGSLFAITGGLFAFVGYMLVSQAYHIPTTIFPRLALLVFIVGMGFHVLQWVPGSVWLATVGEDLRPKLNFHSGLGFYAAEAAEQARWERERELCTEEIRDIEERFERIGRRGFQALSNELEQKKRECASRTAFR